MDEYAGRVLAGRYRLPRPPAHEFELVEAVAFDTYSGQDVLVRQLLLPEVVPAEFDDGDDPYAAPYADPWSGPSGETAHDAGGEVAARALAAARAAAAVPDHPRLAQVFDVLVEDGSLWVVSEYVPGARPVGSVVDFAPLTPYRAAEIAADLLGGLRVLHAHGWTHRNITSSTVLICEDGRALLDGLAFGAAQDALCGYDPVPRDPEAPDGPPDAGTDSGPAGERALQTRVSVVGPVTERWAPEQAGAAVGGDWRRSPLTGPQTDLWALGVLLFRCVQGHAPYPEESTAELLHLVGAAPHGRADECGALRPVVEALLRTDPAQRPAAGEVTGRLRSLVRLAPEPELGGAVSLPAGGPGRLPIVRRRGEVVRRRSRRGRAERAAARAATETPVAAPVPPAAGPRAARGPGAAGRRGEAVVPPGGRVAGGAAAGFAAGAAAGHRAARPVPPAGLAAAAAQAFPDLPAAPARTPRPQPAAPASDWPALPRPAAGPDSPDQAPVRAATPAPPQTVTPTFAAPPQPPVPPQAEAPPQAITPQPPQTVTPPDAPASARAVTPPAPPQTPPKALTPPPAPASGAPASGAPVGPAPGDDAFVPEAVLAAPALPLTSLPPTGVPFALPPRGEPVPAPAEPRPEPDAAPGAPPADAAPADAAAGLTVRSYAPAFGDGPRAGLPALPVGPEALADDPYADEIWAGEVSGHHPCADDPIADDLAVPELSVEELTGEDPYGDELYGTEAFRGPGAGRAFGQPYAGGPTVSHGRHARTRAPGDPSAPPAAVPALTPAGRVPLPPAVPARRTYDEDARYAGGREAAGAAGGRTTTALPAVASRTERDDPRERVPGRRGPRRPGLLLLVSVLVVLAALVGFAMVFGKKPPAGSDRALPAQVSGGDSPSTAPSSAAPGGGAATPATPATPTGAPMPQLAPGFSLRQDPAGFTVAVHDGWTRSAGPDGSVVFTSGGSAYRLTVVRGRDAVGGSAPDAITYETENEPELSAFRASTWSSSSDLRTLQVNGLPAAEGQFSWRDPHTGTELYGLNLAVQRAGHYDVLLLTGPDTDRDLVTAYFTQSAQAFRTG